MVVGRFGYLLVLLVAGLLAGCIGEAAEYELPDEKTGYLTPSVEIEAFKETTPAEGVVFPTIDCSACHMKVLKYVDHVEGGKHCSSCHGGDPHKIHTGKDSIGLDCAACHGSIEALTVPEAEEGYTPCGLCHNPVDPLKPESNLVNIHISRGKPCTVCHTDKIDEIHMAADEGASS